MPLYEIVFSVTGYAKAYVETKEGFDTQELKAKLNRNDVLVSIEPGQPLLDNQTNEIGLIKEVDNQCEYFDFEVRKLGNS